MSMAGKTQPSPIASALELTLLLGGVPLLALTDAGYAVRHALLLAGCAFVVWRLWGSVSWRGLFGPPPPGWWRGPALRGLLVIVGALLYVRLLEPERLLVLPLQRPGLWLLIVALYPLLSVIPQELIYRVYLFEAHAVLWTRPLLPVCVSALAFGWVHIVFAGWFAVVVCTAGGLLLASTYQRFRERPGAVWIVSLEHALYGLALFTAGLGHHFFTPR